jgi:REP element-mobilizing transposase RayT
LNKDEIRTALAKVGRDLEIGNSWYVRTAVVMPDHLHLLISLGQEVALPAVVRLFKGRTAPALRQAALGWQPAYFDHRLRSTDDVLPVFLYIFLNPYRANLVAPTERWVGYYCRPEDWVWFSALTNESVPMPEWLA